MEMIPPEYRRCHCDRGVFVPPDLPRCYLCEEDKTAAERRERYLRELRDRAAVAAMQGLVAGEWTPERVDRVEDAVHQTALVSSRLATALVAALYPEEVES